MKKHTPQAEEYLEAMVRFKESKKSATVSAIATELNVSKASVSEMLKKLAKKGLVEYSRYSTPKLTRKGEKEGKKILRKHRVLERFLALLGIRKSKIHHEACVLEHAISDDVEKALRTAITGNGRLVPEHIKRLTDLKEDECGKILVIMGGRNACQRLADMGLTVGATVCVSRASSRIGPVNIRIRSSSLAIGRGLAEKIFVGVEK